MALPPTRDLRVAPIRQKKEDALGQTGQGCGRARVGTQAGRRGERLTFDKGLISHTPHSTSVFTLATMHTANLIYAELTGEYEVEKTAMPEERWVTKHSGIGDVFARKHDIVPIPPVYLVCRW